MDLFIGNDNVLPVFSLSGQASQCLMSWTGKASFHALLSITSITTAHMHLMAEVIKGKTKPQTVFMMEHAAHVYLYFKPCAGSLVIRVNAQVFWLITPPLYHFGPSPCIYALPQQLLCSLSRRSLLPLSISRARSINTMTNLAVSLRGDFFAPWRSSARDSATSQLCKTK